MTGIRCRLGVCALLWLLAVWGSTALAVDGKEINPPQIKAKAWLLLDHHSGEVLLEHNADTRLDPASLTKIMTVYVLFRKLQDGAFTLEDPVLAGPDMDNVKGAQIFLRPNTAVSAYILINSMIILSANDATLAIVEHVAGSEKKFVAWMNETAKELGLTSTRFTNVTGRAEAGHHTTARDISRLASALVRDFPDYYKWFSLREFSYKQIKHYNGNALLWRDPSVDGIKTGYNRAAGYSLVASASRDQMRLIATVMGAGNDQGRVQAGSGLLEYGFRNFETRLLYKGRTPTINIPVWMGDAGDVPLGLNDNAYVTIPRGSFGKLSAEITVEEVQYAPIQLGQKIGKLRITFDNNMLREYPLVALSAVERGNLLQRTIDRIKLWLQ